MMPALRLLDSLAEVAPADWDRLAGRNPFVRHAFLSGLEGSGSLRKEWGWTPLHPTLWQDETLIAAAPGYLKSNSHGEFVFDHAWAQAYAEHRRSYFPKWLLASPYSPVTGPRLLARNADARARLLRAITAVTVELGLSSAHVNFHLPEEDDSFGPDWCKRIDVQYHWRNPGGWTCFDDFLAAMDHKHRKNIRQERARIARAGIGFRIVDGVTASAAELEAIHDFYLRTFADHGNAPALTLEFIRHLARALPRALVLILAERDNEPVAGALCLRSDDTLYGRYWGTRVQIPGLHFETCYYQGIEYCLREGLPAFEPGAQGQHKLARGFLPTLVRSRHWIADPGFSRAISHWCEQEAESLLAYAQTLERHGPFKEHR